MSDPTQAIVERLGAEAAHLLAALPARVVRVTYLTTVVATRSRRANYRLDLDDGSTVKLRRVADAQQAGRMVDALARSGPGFSSILVHRGDLVLEPWIEGEPVAGLPLDEELVRGGAGLLGRLHRTSIDGAPSGVLETVAAVHAELVRDLDRLASTRALDGTAVRRLRDLAEQDAPEDSPLLGITHQDFCDANLVRGPDGRLHVVDCEFMGVGPVDYDIARTRYRWPMSDRHWDVFLESYRAWRDPAPALAHFTFWTLVALARSARIRLGEPIALREPLERLQVILRVRPEQR